MADRQEDVLRGLALMRDNLEVFCAHALKIKDQQGVVRPFLWNAGQRHIHQALEAQRAKTGMVRAIISKGRQLGSSTYISARFYHKCSMKFGQSAFILAHEQKATDNLYGIVRRYHDNNPIAPSTGATNSKELIFDRLDGGYKLATAGTKDVGRSNTAQLIHASEAAFYDNAAMHMAGIGNTVADLPGTEIILESTSNGVGNYFHQVWQTACEGKGLYIPIFVPWFWLPHLRTKPRRDIKLEPEDEVIMRSYGLDLEQMQWYIDKRNSYGEGFHWLVKQEFPLCAEESFQSPTTNPLISPHHVQAAVSGGYYDEAGALIIGCDPASDGAGPVDRTCIVFRRGRVVFRCEYHEKLNSMQIAGKLADYNREFQPDAIFVDKGGLGTGIVDRLNELNIPVNGVMFGEAASDPKLYENKKAEMWYRMRDWFEDGPVRLVNDAALISDICAPMPDTSSNGRKSVESKRKLAARQIRSPDGGDALALTFAEAVMPKARRDEIVNGSRAYEAPTRAGY